MCSIWWWLPLAVPSRGPVGHLPPDHKRTNPSFYPYVLQYLQNSSIVYADVRRLPGLNRHKDAHHSSNVSDTIEEYYNVRNSKTKMDPRHQHSFSVLKKLMHVGHDDRVLELGCGNGISSRFIHNELKSREVVGVDLSSNRIATARAQVPGVEFMQHDITTLRLPGRTFTVLTQIDSFEHIPRERWDNLFTVWNLHSTVGSRVYLSMPAPEYQLSHYELGIGDMQPVDEVVWPSQLTIAAERRGWSLRYLNYWNRARMDVIMVRQRMGVE